MKAENSSFMQFQTFAVVSLFIVRKEFTNIVANIDAE